MGTRPRWVCGAGDCFLDWIVNLQKEVSMASLQRAGGRRSSFLLLSQTRSHYCLPPRRPWVKGATEILTRPDYAQTFFSNYS